MTSRSIALVALLATAGGCVSGARRADPVGAQRALTRAFIARRDWTTAFAAADGLCRAAPRDAQSWLLRGVVYWEQGLPREAEADFREALRLDEDAAPAHSALAVLLDRQGQGAEALAHHRRAVELQPKEPAYLNNLGFSLFAHGRPREAIDIYYEGLRAAPADPRLRNNLGFAYAAAGDFVRAAAHFDLGGGPAEAKNNLGWAYERRGALAQAYELYSDALRMDPANAECRQNLKRVATALSRQIPSGVEVESGSGEAQKTGVAHGT